MQWTMRPYEGEADYWTVREFLREVFLLYDRHEFCWHVIRWDYWRWHGVENIEHFDLPSVVRLWETDGQLIAVLNPEGRGEAFLQFHPRFVCEALLEEMLEEAWRMLSLPRPEGGRELLLWLNDWDSLAQGVARRNGYAPASLRAEHQRRRPLTGPVPEVPAPPGYVIRALGEVDEHPARTWLSWKAFHPNVPDEKYRGSAWYANIQRAPLYRRDLDLVAVSQEGEMAAFCTVWLDDVTRSVVFEPVGTHPAHQRRGLGKAVMTEGLRRAQRLGATLACIGSTREPAQTLYASLGFTDVTLLEPWVRVHG